MKIYWSSDLPNRTAILLHTLRCHCRTESFLRFLSAYGFNYSNANTYTFPRTLHAFLFVDTMPSKSFRLVAAGLVWRMETHSARLFRTAAVSCGIAYLLRQAVRQPTAELSIKQRGKRWRSGKIPAVGLFPQLYLKDLIFTAMRNDRWHRGPFWKRFSVSRRVRGSPADTSRVSVADTSRVSVADTSRVSVADTSRVSVTDTSRVSVTDTSRVSLGDSAVTGQPAQFLRTDRDIYFLLLVTGWPLEVSHKSSSRLGCPLRHKSHCPLALIHIYVYNIYSFWHSEPHQ